MTGDVEVSPGVWLRYSCDTHRLGPSVRARFSPLSIDSATRQFVAGALAAPAGDVRTRLFQLARQVMSDYDAYGLLGMYGMQLLSTEQARELLGERTRPSSLLDVGAGDGAVTQVLSEALAPRLTKVSVTEGSRVLRQRLRRRGFDVISQDLSQAALPERRFDVITCLNVIDRCARPISLVRHLRSMLANDGRLLLSVPLPLRPHVHVGSHTVDPDESLPLSRDQWELDATAVFEALLQPLGLSLERLCRVPYLSRGDTAAPLYVLDAAVFVLRAG